MRESVIMKVKRGVLERRVVNCSKYREVSSKMKFRRDYWFLKYGVFRSIGGGRSLI